MKKEVPNKSRRRFITKITSATAAVTAGSFVTHADLETAAAQTNTNSKPSDLRITDLRLAGSEGQEGLDIVRTVKENRPATKVILMTAYGDNEVRLKASFLGADSYLEKPIPIEVIRKSLETLTGEGR